MLVALIIGCIFAVLPTTQEKKVEPVPDEVRAVVIWTLHDPINLKIEK